MTDIDNSLPKAQVIEGSKHSWELVVGMEVHAQIKSKLSYFPLLPQTLAVNQILMLA